MISFLIDLVYLTLLAAVSPILLYRRVVHGKYREGACEKLLGKLPVRESDAPLVWLHAVSVGEVLLLRPILVSLSRERPDCQLLITTTTQTGQAVAREKYPDCTVTYFPLDFSWAVKNALRRVRPDLLVLVELELWPNLILEASRQDVPLMIVNGRLSENSFRGYRRVRPLIANLLQRFERIAVQSETYADRFVALGANPDSVVTTGSVKFDQVETDRENAGTRKLRELLGIASDETVLIAGSTQAPEEAYALDTWQSLRDEFSNLRLILVPRHQERFEEVAALAESREIPLVRRSRVDDLKSDNHSEAVILLDTLGELGACWGLADIAFVGGSLGKRGGQNMIEPSAYGAAVLFGPNTQNFRDVVQLLLVAEAAVVVQDAGELTSRVRGLLEDPEMRKILGIKARNVVLPQQGATARTIAEIVALLPLRKNPDLPQSKAA